ncbi:hypothetical protein ACN47E_009223 [Coniothyrium glycines]
MARAYLASSSTSTTTTTTTCLLDSIREDSPPPPTPFNSSSASSRPVAVSSSYPRVSDLAGYSFKTLSMPIELSIVPRAHWLSRLRSCLRLMVIVLSGAVLCMLTHTIEIYRGNRYIDLRKGELPMVWPAHTNLAPTIILFAVAAGNFLGSIAILSLSFKRSFRRPFRSRDMYRIVAGSCGVVMWITALVVFNLLDRASKASLGRYSCTNQNVMSNGRYQYRAVCEEQGVAFYTAIGAASAEVLTLITLGISAIRSAKIQESPLPTIRIREKNNSISSGSQFTKPLKRPSH